MNKITLAQLKEQQQISSLDEYENMDLHHAEDIERFKDIFPKSVEASGKSSLIISRRTGIAFLTD